MSYIITTEKIREFEKYLRLEERSASTARKYADAVRTFYDFLPPDKTVSRERLLTWKNELRDNRAASTVNVMLSAVNSFFAFMSWDDLHTKQIRTQRRIYRDTKRELSRDEYIKLLNTAKNDGNRRLFYLMQTLGATGIRISELRFITVEALKNGRATVDCKGKRRGVLIPKRLREALLNYCEIEGIVSGPVFVTKRGNPMDRSNIWRELRRLCGDAGVDAEKVFPHNFRHLFAVSYYRQEKDVAKLADLLGHASIETTRIYIMESGAEHERQIERLGLVM